MHFLAFAVVLVLTSTIVEGVVLPVSLLTGLNPFNLSAYGLRACWPTLRSDHYWSPPKVLLLGGWLGFSEVGFPPTGLPGIARSLPTKSSLTPPQRFCKFSAVR